MNDMMFRHQVEDARKALETWEAQRQSVATAEIKLRKKVGALIADKNCEAALSTALEAGDLNLAQQVKSFCG